MARTRHALYHWGIQERGYKNRQRQLDSGEIREQSRYGGNRAIVIGLKRQFQILLAIGVINIALRIMNVEEV